MTTPTAPQAQQTQAPAQQSRDGATKIGPFIGGLHNSTGNGEFIANEELFELINLEVDTDGSLANRPQINTFTLTGVTAGDVSFIGTYLPADGRKFIVANCPGSNDVVLIDASSGVKTTPVATGVQAACCMQYANRLFVVATVASGANGGFFDVPTSSTVSWTYVASMPRGEACAQYRERMFIACGINATVNTSRFSYSSIGDPSVAWSGTDFFDVVPGNGQKLVSLIRVGNDLVLFKEHSTHKFTYTSDVRKAEINEIDGTIGNPAINCAVVYNNSIVYVLHDNSVYELFQFNYTRISGNINLVQVSDATMYSKDQYCLTLHRDRLFVRYYTNLYVSNLKVKKWCLWQSTRKFSKLVVVPSASVGLDNAYAMSSSSTNPGSAYRFQDTRVTTSTGVSDVVSEWFQGKITTKTFDFDAPQSYKVLFWWGIAVATSANVYSTITIPNATRNLTWAEAQTAYGSWLGAAAVGAKWSSNPDASVTKTVLPQLGKYSRKFIKLPKKIRFRQVIFSLTFDILTNAGIADATLRIYDLTIFIKQKQTVVKEVS